MRVLHLNPGHSSQNEILVEGLEQEVRLFQLSDTHLSQADGRDPHPARQAADQYQTYFQQRTSEGVPVSQVFAGLLAQGRAFGPQALALTGDILHFPSVAGLELLAGSLKGQEYLYTLGNHDWYFPYLQWSEATRLAHYPRFFAFSRGNPACQSRDISGLRLVALDNSTYQVSTAQVEFLRGQLEGGRPTVLLMHIPLQIPSLMPSVMARWQAPIVMGGEEGWTLEMRAKWLVQGVAASTRACLDLVREAPNLVAILCGHVHFPRADALSPGCYQYVSKPGFEGGCRSLIFKPYR